MTARRILAAALLIGAVVALVLILNWPNVRERRQAAFIAAALRGDSGRMKLLLALGASAEKPACNTPLCPSPLIAASINGNSDAVQLLLDRGANVNGKMKRGQSALIAAAYEGHANVARLLLSKGADVNADWEGCTSLGVAKQQGHTEIADLLLKAGATNFGNCDK